MKIALYMIAPAVGPEVMVSGLRMSLLLHGDASAFPGHRPTPGLKHSHNDCLKILQEAGLPVYVFLLLLSLVRVLKGDRQRPFFLPANGASIF